MSISCDTDVVNGNLIREALNYQRRGWCVIPLSPRSKKAARKWEEFQKRRPSQNEVRRLFADSDYNVGVVCGEVSGGLAVRDFDSPDSYANWAASHREDARVLPTVKTGRSGAHHVYFSVSNAELAEIRSQYAKSGRGRIGLGDGELNADVGCYVVTPPSIHPSGAKYTWLTKPGVELPSIDPRKAGLLDRWDHTPLVQSNRSGSNSVHSVHSVVEGEESGDGGGLSVLERAIRATQPRGKGQRRNCLFDFARIVAGIHGLTESERQAAIRRWHELALPVIGTKPFDDTRFDFEEALANVRFPLVGGSAEVIAEALQAADSQPPPKCAEGYEATAIRRLVGLCAELHRRHGTAVFFLSCRDAGRVLGIDYKTAAKYLRGLCRDQVLKDVWRPPRGSQRAIRYQFVGEI